MATLKPKGIFNFPSLTKRAALIGRKNWFNKVYFKIRDKFRPRDYTYFYNKMHHVVCTGK